jgi:hypothetical protein
MGLFYNSTYHRQQPYGTEYLLPAEMYPHLTFFTMEKHGVECENASRFFFFFGARQHIALDAPQP